MFKNIGGFKAWRLPAVAVWGSGHTAGSLPAHIFLFGATGRRFAWRTAAIYDFHWISWLLDEEEIIIRNFLPNKKSLNQISVIRTKNPFEMLFIFLNEKLKYVTYSLNAAIVNTALCDSPFCIWHQQFHQHHQSCALRVSWIPCTMAPRLLLLYMAENKIIRSRFLWHLE